MKRISAFMILLMSLLMVAAEDYIESYNVVSDNYNFKVQDVQIIRPINGGTVITPIFDDSCPEEIKAPFSYACKIVEEYMPTCLPLKVKVSCGRINSSTSEKISQTRARTKENFGSSKDYKNAQMSVIKGVILAELCYNSSVTYLDYVPNVEFFTEFEDIEIKYNSQFLNSISFSLESDPGQNYDFVSLAIRDLLIGLGLTHNFKYNIVNNTLQNPSNELTPYETYIDDLLGNYDNPSARLVKGTQGNLIIKKNMVGGNDLKLYAPNPWDNNSSLRYFIPIDGCDISSILSYDFCRGQVTRSLSDKYSDFFFRELLGWKENFYVSTSTPSSGKEGSTSMIMPYNGSLTLSNKYGIAYSIEESIQPQRNSKFVYTDNEELNQYIEIHHPHYPINTFSSDHAFAISILKKDGTWDVVESHSYYPDNETLSMSNWTFSFDADQYARTVDGYLRARITTKKRQGSLLIYNTTYFVVDYLPQKITLGYTYLNASSSKIIPSIDQNDISVGNMDMVRIFFSNTEGLERILLERLRQGARIPSKIEITDLKKGYYDTTIDRTTTFTAVGYNANGTSRSIPITISLSSDKSSLAFSIKEQNIKIESGKENTQDYYYDIIPIGTSSQQIKYNGITKDIIDISNLSNGLYMLTVRDINSVLLGYMKFKK